MNEFSKRKTVTLTKEEKRKISSDLKALSLSREEMENLVKQLENEFSNYDKLATHCSNRYQAALKRRESVREEVSQKRKEINEKTQKETRAIQSESVGFIGTLFQTKEYKDKESRINKIQELLMHKLNDIYNYEKDEEEAINKIISAKYDLDGKQVNGGKYWYEMRYRAVSAKTKISELKKLISKNIKDEKLLELKASAAKNYKKTRTLASPVKSRINEQFKILDQCPYCFTKMDEKNAHADHIYPVSKGGLSTPKNMVFICANCNLSKGNKTLNQFIKENNLQRSTIEKNLDLLNKDY